MELTGYGLTVESIERVVKGEKVTIAPELIIVSKLRGRSYYRFLIVSNRFMVLILVLVKIRIEKSRKIKLRNLIVS